MGREIRSELRVFSIADGNPGALAVSADLILS